MTGVQTCALPIYVNVVPLIQGDFLSGYVGIGTTTPQNKLNVIGDANVTGNLYVNGELVGGSGSFVPYTGATADLDLGAHSFIVNTNQLYVNATSGNVGIGTSSPETKLEIVGATGDLASIKLYTASGNSPAITSYSGGTYVQTYWNSVDNAMYTQVVGNSASSVVFRNYASGATLTMLS